MPPQKKQNAPSEEERIRVGELFLSCLFQHHIEHVINLAIKIYDVLPDQAAALRQVFLKGGDYRIEADGYPPS